jgi:hypothetical protein
MDKCKSLKHSAKLRECWRLEKRKQRVQDKKKEHETKAETAKKPTSNCSAKECKNTLFSVLDSVLSPSHQKIYTFGNSDRAKRGWVRVIVSAVSAYGYFSRLFQMGAHEDRKHETRANASRITHR